MRSASNKNRSERTMPRLASLRLERGEAVLTEQDSQVIRDVASKARVVGDETEPEYLSAREVALKFNVSEKTIKRLVSDRRIPFVRIGTQLRFPALLLEDWSRNPDLVAKQWFAGKEAAGKREETNGSDQTAGEELGRSLFLYGSEWKKERVLQKRIRQRRSRDET
jgi:excisionase family DNA binding protein